MNYVIDPDAPAFPFLSQKGLTKREEFAKAAMQGLLSGIRHGSLFDYQGVICDAVACADALLKELEK